jgi:uncharacterized membrane protein YbhN (UPF0104 family)
MESPCRGRRAGQPQRSGAVVVELSSVSAQRLVASVALALAIQALIAHRLTLLAALQDISLKLGSAIEINLTSMFYGLFVPGGNVSRLAIRSYKLAQPSRKAVASVATILFDRIVATVALGLVGQTFWLLDRPRDTLPVGLILFGTWAVPAGMWVLARIRPRQWESGPGEDAAATGTAAVRRRLRAVWEAASRFADMGFSALVYVLVVSVATQVLAVFIYLLLAFGLGIEIGFVRMAWIASATAVLTLLPVTPSGIGVREGALVFLLGRYGTAGPEALALSFLFFACTIVLVGLAGGVMEGNRWLRRAGR